MAEVVGVVEEAEDREEEGETTPTMTMIQMEEIHLEERLLEGEGEREVQEIERLRVEVGELQTVLREERDEEERLQQKGNEMISMVSLTIYFSILAPTRSYTSCFRQMVLLNSTKTTRTLRTASVNFPLSLERR
jgi:hypothetical protein